jgi:hypothetical protein
MKEIVLRTEDGFLIEIRDQQSSASMVNLKVGMDGSPITYVSRKNIELLRCILAMFLERT